MALAGQHRGICVKMPSVKEPPYIKTEFLYNARGSTAVTPWSLRARWGAPVAVRIEWDDPKQLKPAAAFTLGSIDERLAAPCPYIEQVKQLQCIDDETASRIQEWIDAQSSPFSPELRAFSIGWTTAKVCAP